MPRTPRALRPIGRTSFIEAHGLAGVGEQHDVMLAVGQVGADQVVAIVQIHGDDAGLARVGEVGQRVFLTVPRVVAMNT